MATATPIEPPAGAAGASSRERRALGVASGAHVLHDGYTDLIWVALPIWQAEQALSYAAVGALRMVYTGTMACLQIPASRVAERAGGALVLALGTALSGLCYVLAGAGSGFWWLLAALFLGGLGAATQHPIGSALVTRTFTGARALSAFGAYNFAGDVGKVLLPALAALLILFMPWRPAYALLGLIGILVALPLFLLTPRLPPERRAVPHAPPAGGAAMAAEEAAPSPVGFRILVAFGIADSVVRGALFVLLPFLLIAKGAAVTTAGVALTLVFVGGAAGKLACAWVVGRIGTVATIVAAQALTAAGIVAVLLVPLAPALALLPPLGVALNGVTTVIYGSVPAHVAPHRRTHALSVFYTVTIGSAALAPPFSGLVGDLVGIPAAIVAVAVLTLATIPLVFRLGEERRPSPAL